MSHDDYSNKHQTKGRSVMKITTVGLDIAKTVFHFYGVNRAGKLVKKKVLKRAYLLSFFAKLEPSEVVMEACGSANYWYRKLSLLGHTVKLIAPQYVIAYRRKSKNDFNDAQAIAEAAQRADMNFVEAKSIPQQDIQMLIRIRDRQVRMRTKLNNQIRGLLSEYGITIAVGKAALKHQLPEIIDDKSNELTDISRVVFRELYEEYCLLNENVDKYEKKITTYTKDEPVCIRLRSIIGIGNLTAAALYAAVNDAKQFKNGRHLAAWCGLVPKQHSTGGKTILRGITKKGNPYLRSLLVHGARAVLKYCSRKTDRLSVWAEALKNRSCYNKACVALANKLARIAWVVMAKEQSYVAQ
jgi:transposase